MNSAIEKVDKRDFDIKLYLSYKKEGKCFKDIIYNQKEVSNYSCTTHAPCGAFSDMTGLPISLGVRKVIWKRQLKTGGVADIGDTFQNGMKQTSKVLEIIFGCKFLYYRKELTEKNIKAIIDNESSIVTGYKGSLRSDAEDNGKIDIKDHKGNGGHCIRIVKYFYIGSIFCIKYVDNYKGVYTHNVITYEDFLKDKDFFSHGYFFKIQI